MTKVSISEQDKTSWRHRHSLRALPTQWHSEALTSAICRYLNSGIPVLLATSDHVRVIVGYVRNMHLSGQESPGQDPHRVEHFILNDDREGPYRILHLQDLFGESDQDDVLIFTPPPALILSADNAEVLGASRVETEVSRALTIPDISAERRDAFTVLSKRMHDEGDIAVRTFAMEGNLFKQSFLKRCGDDPSACALVATCRLPKYVWVCELVDRKVRDAASTDPVVRMVVGEVVIDATAADPATADVLLMHLPSLVAVHDTQYGEVIDAECRLDVRYPSARWAQNDAYLNEITVAQLLKTSGMVG